MFIVKLVVSMLFLMNYSQAQRIYLHTLLFSKLITDDWWTGNPIRMVKENLQSILI